MTFPRSRPAICGCDAGAVWPAAIVTLVGEMVNLEVLLLDSVIVTAFAAGAGRVTANVETLPSPTPGFAGRLIVPGAFTVTFAVAFAMLGVAVVAVMVAVP